MLAASYASACSSSTPGNPASPGGGGDGGGSSGGLSDGGSGGDRRRRRHQHRSPFAPVHRPRDGGLQARGEVRHDRHAGQLRRQRGDVHRPHSLRVPERHGERNEQHGGVGRGLRDGDRPSSPTAPPTRTTSPRLTSSSARPPPARSPTAPRAATTAQFKGATAAPPPRRRRGRRQRRLVEGCGACGERPPATSCQLQNANCPKRPALRRERRPRDPGRRRRAVRRQQPVVGHAGLPGVPLLPVRRHGGGRRGAGGGEVRGARHGGAGVRSERRLERLRRRPLLQRAQSQCAALQFVAVGGVCDSVALVCQARTACSGDDGGTTGTCAPFAAGHYCPSGTCTTSAIVCARSERGGEERLTRRRATPAPAPPPSTPPLRVPART